MSGFDRLHSAVRYHIVNSLGWRELRPLQEEAVEPIVAGDNVILCGPTAGGKTEAAVFPLMTRMLEENWQGLSIIYLCPLKALLNNLEPRLTHYFGLVGRRVGIWHGDVGTSERAKITRGPPELLLTTPESIEVMLTTRTRSSGFLGHVRVVVVDELHAFAGDDRGWHLWAILQRLGLLGGRDSQRIALSATVGNPGRVLSWLASTSERPERSVIVSDERDDVEVSIDYVGGISNAATVIERLHRGEKRLVFCDSRAQVEELAFELRELGVQTYVSHSSLSVDERRQAEQAFAEGGSCVIVSTSTLELGIDVGDLDRVIQIGAPSTVSSFLQRLGRSGRRPGTSANLLFLCITSDQVLLAAALVLLWKEGWLEAVTPPAEPYHILVQQLLGLSLQTPGFPRHEWVSWLGGGQGLSGLDEGEAVLDHLIAEGYLFEDSGRLAFGATADDRFSGKRRLDLFSAFTTSPFFTVLHGNRELGSVAPTSFHQSGQTQPTILLGGRSWTVTHVDWDRGRAFVEPAKSIGRSRWPGGGRGLSYEVCQAIRRVLTARPSLPLSRRAESDLEDTRGEFHFLEEGKTSLVPEATQRWRWWTFGGQRANAVLTSALRDHGATVPSSDDLGVLISHQGSPGPIIESLRVGEDIRAWADPRSTDSLKFSELLAPDLARRIVEERLTDRHGARLILDEPRIHVDRAITDDLDF